MNSSRAAASACIVVGLVSGTALGIDIETVPVANPGNAADTRYATPGYGSVAYSYSIGKYEVTAGQYCEFLNAVAKTDTHGLYTTKMTTYEAGCNILRSGTSGRYTYTVGSAYANRPVNWVTFWDACRFANWLHNGQPSGSQGPGTTETGAYTLTTLGLNNNSVSRNAGWKWAVSTVDEWYKAAYYSPSPSTYYDYPTSSSICPGRDLTDTFGNNANYYIAGGSYPIDPPYYNTVVGQFRNSSSPYGTFDQGGNVWEWTETKYSGLSRGVRGGAKNNFSSSMLAWSHNADYAGAETSAYGFRIVYVPEPTTLVLLLFGGLKATRRTRRQGSR